MASPQNTLDPTARLRHVCQLIVVSVILLGLTLIAVFWGPLLWDLLSDQERFKTWIESYEEYAVLVFIATQMLQVILFFIPGEVTQFAGGYIFGTWLGLVLSYIGITLGAVTAFYLARFFEHAAIDLLVDRQTLRRFDRLVYGKSGFWPMFILFLVPGVPKDLLCYIAGLTPMHVVTFVTISTIGRFPGVLLSSIFGDGLAERSWTTVGLSTVIALGFIGIVYLFRKPIERFRRTHLVTEDEKDLQELPSQETQPVNQPGTTQYVLQWQNEWVPPAELHPTVTNGASDTISSPSCQPFAWETQKHDWLAQQKMAWFDERRALWEAEDKPLPWAEWIARRESEWTANELPNRELQWGTNNMTEG